jgi:hypothetical protein
VNVGELYRREYGRILATLMRSVGSFDLVKTRWRNPSGWAEGHGVRD